MSADPTSLVRQLSPPAPVTVAPPVVAAAPAPVVPPAVPVAAPAAPTPARAATREARVRVLQLGPALEVMGGVSTVQQLICDYLPTYANIRHVATTHEGSWPARFVTFGRAAFTLSRALESIEPTVVHIHFSSRGSTLRKLLLAQIVIKSRYPLILHAHGGFFDQFHRGLPPMVRRMVNRTLQQANVVVVLSSQWREFYIRECELAPSQVVILPNPVRVPARIVDRANRREVKFIHLAKLGKGKGTFDLVKAFQSLPPELRARARLVLAGNGEVAATRRLAAGEDRISVLSWVDPAERDRLLAESDVFVLPSYVEGVPMSLLEAMAAGLPSITTPVGGIPDVFTSGAEGLLVKPGDTAQLADAMARLIRDESFRLDAGRRAHERARASDVHAYARRLADLYQRIAPVAEARMES